MHKHTFSAQLSILNYTLYILEVSSDQRSSGELRIENWAVAMKTQTPTRRINYQLYIINYTLDNQL